MMRFICSSATLLKAPKELVIGKAYSVGRSSKCSFVLNERSVSRAHAEIEVGTQQLLIKDLESLNGTYVDGTKIKHVELQPGQKVHFGIVQFRLIRGEEPIDQMTTLFRAHRHLSYRKRRPPSRRYRLNSRKDKCGFWSS